VAGRLDSGGGTVLAATVSTLEDDGANVLFTERAVDGVCQWFGLVSARSRAVV